LLDFHSLADASICQNKPRTMPKSREALGTAWAGCSHNVSRRDLEADRQAERLRRRYGLTRATAYTIAELAYG
jgi:hypothetical protein